MVLIIAAAVLILAIALFQVIQGVFSSLLMAIMAVLSAAVALAFYENLASLLYPYQPAYADAVALAAVFILPLLGLRLVADRFIPSNVVLGVWGDRICGGACGLITGTITVGILTIVLQLLPFGPTVMTFKPFDDALQRQHSLAPFYCDQTTLALSEALSAGPLSGARKLSDSHDDLLLEAFCARNTAEKFGRTDAAPDALRSVSVFEAPDARLAQWRFDLPASGDMAPTDVPRVLVVRCEVDASASDGAGQAVSKRLWRLPATHFRLVTGSGKSHYPVAYLTHKAGLKRGLRWQGHSAEVADNRPQIAKLVVVRPAPKEAESLMVDWVYLVGPDEQPQYVVFRRVSKQAVTADSYKQGRMPDARTALDREGLTDDTKKKARARSAR